MSIAAVFCVVFDIEKGPAVKGEDPPFSRPRGDNYDAFQGHLGHDHHVVGGDHMINLRDENTISSGNHVGGAGGTHHMLGRYFCPDQELCGKPIHIIDDSDYEFCGVPLYLSGEHYPRSCFRFCVVCSIKSSVTIYQKARIYSDYEKLQFLDHFESRFAELAVCIARVFRKLEVDLR